MDQILKNLLAKAMKFLEENIEEELYDTGSASDFFSIIPKAEATEEEIDKLDFIKIQHFCASKNTNSKVKKGNPDFLLRTRGLPAS